MTDLKDLRKQIVEGNEQAFKEYQEKLTKGLLPQMDNSICGNSLCSNTPQGLAEEPAQAPQQGILSQIKRFVTQ